MMSPTRHSPIIAIMDPVAIAAINCKKLPAPRPMAAWIFVVSPAISPAILPAEF